MKTGCLSAVSIPGESAAILFQPGEEYELSACPASRRNDPESSISTFPRKIWRHPFNMPFPWGPQSPPRNTGSPDEAARSILLASEGRPFHPCDKEETKDYARAIRPATAFL